MKHVARRAMSLSAVAALVLATGCQSLTQSIETPKLSLVSINLLIPLAPDFPVLGGKTLKINAGAELAYRQSRPVVKIKGVSLMGVPMPNAWLGGIKNIDLIQEFGVDEGFWARFADGVESINVVEGFLRIQLKE